MPQPERAKNMREILKYLRDLSPGAVSMAQLIRTTQVEITALGAREGTIRNYINTLHNIGFLKISKGLKVSLSEQGQKWLSKQGF